MILCIFLSLDKLDSLDDDYDKLGSDSGSSGTYSYRAISLRFDNYVGSVSVLGSDNFASTGVQSKCDVFCVWRVHTKLSHFQMWSAHKNVLALKFLILFPNLKTSFIVIVIVIPYLTHSNLCSFTKNMIRRASTGTIRRPLDSGIRGNEATAFIQ